MSAEAGESYFVHVNVDDFCATESTCRNIMIARQSALPITLASFKATLLNDIEKRVIIDWSTHSESNNDYFTIYKSYDGYVWFELSKVQGAGNSNTILNYSTIDNNPKEGHQYYKLRQTDYDGNWEEFDIVSVSVKLPRTMVVESYNQIGQSVSPETKGIIFLVWDNGDITKTFNH